MEKCKLSFIIMKYCNPLINPIEPHCLRADRINQGLWIKVKIFYYNYDKGCYPIS